MRLLTVQLTFLRVHNISWLMPRVRQVASVSATYSTCALRVPFCSHIRAEQYMIHIVLSTQFVLKQDFNTS